jgi:subtilisin family serine protease
LPDGVTVRDVYSQRENRQYLSDLSLDVYSHVSDAEEETTEETTVRQTSAPNYTVTDPYYSLQSYLNYLNMDDTWNSYKGNGITVAIIDTGIDTDHPEFAGKISEYSYNSTDDKIVKDYKTTSGEYDWSLIEDEQGHGTAVAGVIAASMNGEGIVGIAPNVNLLIIKAECSASGAFYNTSDLVFGLYYAIERDADVVNMSFGIYGSNPFASATKLAVDSDIICVAAAGNNATTQLNYPAADENVIGVGALAENSWELASYSNYGENSDIVAPA